MTVAGLPYPPYELMRRVGSLDDEPSPRETYETIGRVLHGAIMGMLPEAWSHERRRVLDFGCGAGRVLRHFAADPAGWELVGYDIDAPSVEWANGNLAPLRFGVCGDLPPLPEPDESFDVIYAISVFTHLPTSWSAWLRELHRLLAPGGLLIFSFIAAPAARDIGLEFDERRIGMHALNHGNDWDQGGPIVLHAPWWLERRLGRVFEVVSLRETLMPEGVTGEPRGAERRNGHSLAIARKDARPAPPIEEIERVDDSDPREIDALSYSLERSWRESAAVRRNAVALERQNEDLRRHAENLERHNANVSRHAENLERHNANVSRHAENLERHDEDLRRHAENLERHNANVSRHAAALRSENARLEQALATVSASRSWRLTAPLRELRDRVDPARRGAPNR